MTFITIHSCYYTVSNPNLRATKLSANQHDMFFSIGSMVNKIRQYDHRIKQTLDNKEDI